MAKEEKAVLEDLFYGKNAFLFWFTQVVGLLIPIIILILTQTKIFILITIKPRPFLGLMDRKH